MTYEMAVWKDNSSYVEFIKLYFYTKREAVALAREHEEVTLYDANGKVIFQRLKKEE